MLNKHQLVSRAEEEDKVIVYERGHLLFVFNFHSTDSHEAYEIGTLWKSDHFILFDTDEARFGGHGRLEQAHGTWFPATEGSEDKRLYSLKLYLPSRCAICLCALESCQEVGDVAQMPALSQG